MTGPDDQVTVSLAGPLDREEAQVASLQRVRPSTLTGAWTVFCTIGAMVVEAVHLLA